MRKAKAWTLTLEGSEGPEDQTRDYRRQDVWAEDGGGEGGGGGQNPSLSITVLI